MVQDINVISTAQLEQEVARRRTFAIISHPDAGKTTLTEKLLLYAGAVDIAGTVRTKKNQRHATSDWMAIEQQRGISITSTVLQFDYEGHRFNLLDTPGHQDFSEDTYRTLTAVDSAVMVLDCAKGIEPQTLKLFEVCRMRHIPILTFINKMDMPGRDPLDLLDEIERVLGIAPVPMNWPIGDGHNFQGVYDLNHSRILRFERTTGGQHRVPVQAADLNDPALGSLIGETICQRLREEVALIDGAGTEFDNAQFLQGSITPVFFGSAINNFGVEVFLRSLIDLAPPPVPRMSNQGPVYPTDDQFTGFVFKVQANMDPHHRDRMAFVRICSGRFQKDMQAFNPRLGKTVRLNRVHRLFAQDREIVEEAFPGDVVGLTNTGLTLGDTLSSGAPIAYDPIPRFQPERFGMLRLLDITKSKHFRKGLEQLEEEGVIQVLYATDSSRREPILAAVGTLQFDVVAARLEAEYGVRTSVDFLPHSIARWIEGRPEAIEQVTWYSTSIRARDRKGEMVVLFHTPFEADYVARNNPDITFKTLN
ncbi:MAG: peptide chain release factor 3 [Anaerolineae bacterium]|nr:peptide chain release factor 3 [Anaerolineae bacterium]